MSRTARAANTRTTTTRMTPDAPALHSPCDRARPPLLTWRRRRQAALVAARARQGAAFGPQRGGSPDALPGADPDERRDERCCEPSSTALVAAARFRAACLALADGTRPCGTTRLAAATTGRRVPDVRAGALRPVAPERVAPERVVASGRVVAVPRGARARRSRTRHARAVACGRTRPTGSGRARSLALRCPDHGPPVDGDRCRARAPEWSRPSTWTAEGFT